MTLSELQIYRDALIVSIAQGYKQLASGDKSVTFQDIDQRVKALSILNGEIAAAGGTVGTRFPIGRFITSDGF